MKRLASAAQMGGRSTLPCVGVVVLLMHMAWEAQEAGQWIQDESASAALDRQQRAERRMPQGEMVTKRSSWTYSNAPGFPLSSNIA